MNDYDLTQAQLEEISREVAENQPLIGALEPDFASLKHTLASDQNASLLSNLERLIATQRYRGVRRVRGDGNCFFRACMFSLIRQLQANASEHARLQRFLQSSLDLLLRVGYERVGVEMFQEMMLEFFQDELMQCNVEQVFNSQAESEYIVWYARLLCAAQLRANGERFLPFLPPGPDGRTWQSVKEFCESEVEPQGRECEEPQIIALAEILGIRVQIEYLSAASLTSNVFGPNNAETTIALLYRPGHYDVLD